MGFAVLLVGRRLKNSPDVDERPYQIHRMNLFLEKGAGFYLEYQIRLFFFLLFHRAGLLVSNDLDTLAPNFMISRLKRIPLVYDSHEYFTGVPELIRHPLKRKLWKWIEQMFMPRIKDFFTVNESIALLYANDYKVDFNIVRNVPEKFPFQTLDRQKLGLPYDRHILIMQGSGINVERGAEELVEAMQQVDDALLLIVGGGDVLPVLKEQVKKLKLENKVLFKPRMPYLQLMQYTAAADLGLSLDKGTSINYLYSLPNKLFDYIHAGIPVLVSDLPEVRKVVEEYGVGDFIPDHDPNHIAGKINGILNQPEKIRIWKMNTVRARNELNWENESVVLKEVYSRYL